MSLDDYARKSFESADAEELTRLCRGLAEHVASGLGDVGDWAKHGQEVAKRLRKLDHDLQSADEDDDFQAWCGGSRKSKKASGELRLFLHSSGGVEVTWRDGGSNTSAHAGG